MKVLIVVDMQNDFIDGSLGNKESEAIIPNVEKKILEWEGLVVATQDTHQDNYLNTQEGKNLPIVHCVMGTRGWELHPTIKNALEKKHAQVINKSTFSSVPLAMMLIPCGVREIHVVGLCTDICVISNAFLLKAHLPEVPIFVDSSCCAGVSKEKHEAALETMRSCQINVQ